MTTFDYTYDELIGPVFQAIQSLGGSAHITEIESALAQLLHLSEEQINDVHRRGRSKLSYRAAWARNYLKNYGVIENSQRGVWSLTKQGSETTGVDASEVVKQVKKAQNENRVVEDADEQDPSNAEDANAPTWQDKLLDMIKTIDPKSFEHLCQRILRESGFVNVEVTGKSGDGGIDGKGTLILGDLISFHVIFQAKRYDTQSISPKIVREFRGAMNGRADKGLIITTSTFSNQAIAEARRDGAPPIDLIDGYQLAQKMKDLGLGVRTVETIEIDEEWIKTL